MKLKTKKLTEEAQITFDYNEIQMLKETLNKWNELSLSYLPMTKICELIEKLGTAKQTIERNQIPRH